MPVIERVYLFQQRIYNFRENRKLFLGDKLANFLNLNIGDTLVLIGQGYHGTTAAGKFRIAGIVKIANPGYRQ